MSDWKIVKVNDDELLDFVYDYVSLPIFETKVNVILNYDKLYHKYLLRVLPQNVFLDINTNYLFTEFTEDEIREINKEYFKILDDERNI